MIQIYKTARNYAVPLMLALAGCNVVFVSDYDDQIDSGLTQMNTDVSVFVSKMISEANTAQGTYKNNKDFYVTQEAKADTLIVRAEAHKALNSCPSVDTIAKAISSAAPASQAEIYINQVPKDDCSVVLLTLIKQNLVKLQEFHEAQGDAGIPPSAHDIILTGGLGSLLRSAITVELAKKTGKTVGGS